MQGDKTCSQAIDYNGHSISSLRPTLHASVPNFKTKIPSNFRKYFLGRLDKKIKHLEWILNFGLMEFNGFE